MKKLAVVVLAAVFSGLVGCGGGGSTAEPDPVVLYDFNGRWIVSSTITKNTCGGGAVQGTITIVENAGKVTVEIPASGLNGAQVGSGVCDRATGAILFDVPSSHGGVTRWDGRGVDEQNMAGARKIVGGRCEFEANWTAALIGRN